MNGCRHLAGWTTRFFLLNRKKMSLSLKTCWYEKRLLHANTNCSFLLTSERTQFLAELTRVKELFIFDWNEMNDSFFDRFDNQKKSNRYANNYQELLRKLSTLKAHSGGIEGLQLFEKSWNLITKDVNLFLHQLFDKFFRNNLCFSSLHLKQTSLPKIMGAKKIALPIIAAH